MKKKYEAPEADVVQFLQEEALSLSADSGTERD